MCWKQTSNSCPDPNKAAAAISDGSRLGSSFISSLKLVTSGLKRSGLNNLTLLLDY